MRRRTLGPFQVSPISYDCMPLSIEGRPPRETAIGVLHDVLDAGVNHLETARACYLSGEDPLSSLGPRSPRWWGERALLASRHERRR